MGKDIGKEPRPGHRLRAEAHQGRLGRRRCRLRHLFIGDALLGEGGTDKAVEKGKDLISGVGDALGGVREGASGLFGGLGNLVSGIFGGGTSSLVGLIAAGMMLFGNFGWMGKIVCGLIAAMSFGLFGGQQSSQAQQLAAAPLRGQDGDRQQSLLPETEGDDEENGQVIYRPRR